MDIYGNLVFSCPGPSGPTEDHGEDTELTSVFVISVFSVMQALGSLGKCPDCIWSGCWQGYSPGFWGGNKIIQLTVRPGPETSKYVGKHTEKNEKRILIVNVMNIVETG